jgi:pyruvate/2-oxoglutarate dehydrogenase complex dihydrolipoamide dehydrogenase (E3) component
MNSPSQEERMDRFDVIVIGMGPGGEAAAGRLLQAGRRVAVIERELIGGECAYWACIPSKTLLRGPEARAEAGRVAGVATPAMEWPGLRDYRDYMVRHLDDTAQISGYEQAGATVIKAPARIAGPGQVEAAGQLLQAGHIVIATGSQPVRPAIDGLDDTEVWTNREATTVRDIPGRVLLVGGSAVGVELGQFYARMGAQVTIVQRAGRLIDREDPRVGELAAEALAADGITIRSGTTAIHARRAAASTVVTLDDGSQVDTDVVILGAGRHPATTGLGLEDAGVTLTGRGGIAVDDRCRAREGLWAVGDVTGVALFTHVAMYQGRVVADNILGRDRAAAYEGIPRVVFADPEIAAVGLTAAQAAARGISTATAEVALADAIARPWTYERDPRGTLGLLADRERRVLAGAWAVAPLASEWIHQAALAIRAQIPIRVLLDQVAQFPTYTEAYLAALEQLRP